MNRIEIIKLYLAKLCCYLVWAVECFVMELENLKCDWSEAPEAKFEIWSYQGHGRSVKVFAKYQEDAIAAKVALKKIYGNADYKRISE